MNKLLLTFYGDDFTGSTDALEQLTLAGIRTVLFVEPPTRAQLKRFPDVQAVGIAGMSRAMAPGKMITELRPALQSLKKLGARHVHYKVCSTFDSSPRVGSIGAVLELAAKIFPAPFVPILAAAPTLGRYTIFGNHFARFGIGSAGAIHRLDRHPSVSKHPVTPMTEADLRLHLAKQTKKRVALFDILKVSLPDAECRGAFKAMLADGPDAVLFDALDAGHLRQIGKLLDRYANEKRPLFSIGSSGIDAALSAHWISEGRVPRVPKYKDVKPRRSPAVKQILIGSGSCSPVTSAQIAWALKHGYAEVSLSAAALASRIHVDREMQRAMDLSVKLLNAGRSVIIHTTRRGSERSVSTKLKDKTAEVLGTALGRVLRGALERTEVRRVCIAGGDTSSFAARALGVEALEMIAPLTPGAPLCRAFAPGSPVDGREVVFKGGQVGSENYFQIAREGNV